MTSAKSRFNILPLQPHSRLAERKLDQFQTDLVSEALRRAVEDANAAMAHRLSEPLTSLLLYLNEIKQAAERLDGSRTFPVAMREMVTLALRETERVCDIMELAGQNIERSVESAVSRSREAINSWSSDGDAGTCDRASPGRIRVRDSLTPREHEVLAIVVGGASNKEGGHRLGISIRTFEVHRAHLMGKLGARNTADLVRISLDGVR